MKLASNTDDQALAVGCDTPQSDANDEKLSSCATRPALSYTNRWKATKSPTFAIERTSRSKYVATYEASQSAGLN